MNFKTSFNQLRVFFFVSVNFKADRPGYQDQNEYVNDVINICSRN